MHKAFKFRLYPTKEQATMFNKAIGCNWFVFNHFLAKWKDTYEEIGKGLMYNLCSGFLTQTKKEIDSTSLQNSLKNLADSFARFFKKQNQYPRFKSRKNKVQTYTSQCNYPQKGRPTMEVVENQIKLPKVGWVKFAKSREVKGRILAATIRRSPTEKYFVSILCEMNSSPHVRVDKRKTVGVDLGLKDFAILTDGTKVRPCRFFCEYEKKLAKAQWIV